MKKIAIHSVPRSGSTWLGCIFDSHPEVIYKFQPLFSYKFKGFLNELSSKERIEEFFFKIANTSDIFLDQEKDKSLNLVPSFKKNRNAISSCKTVVYKEVRYHYILKNLLEKDDAIRVIGLVRNPLSVISSWLKAPSGFRVEKGWKIEEEWRFAPKKNLDKPEEFFGFEKWKEVMYLFECLKRQYPDRFYLLNYADLLKDKIKIVKNLFSFCQLNFPQQTYDYLRQSLIQKNEEAYSVFKEKDKDDKWENNLPDYIIDSIKMDTDFINFNKKYLWV